MKLVRVSGELQVLGANSALRLLHQLHLAQKYPSCYPQFRLTFRNALRRLFCPWKRPAFFV